MSKPSPQGKSVTSGLLRSYPVNGRRALGLLVACLLAVFTSMCFGERPARMDGRGAKSPIQESIPRAVATNQVTNKVYLGSEALSHFILPFTATPLAATAVYDSVLKAPKCGSLDSSCDSGTLLNGRDNISGGAEPNQPNTINNSCPDGTTGTYHFDESIDAIKVSTLDASKLAPGKTVKIEVTLWAYTSFNQDHLDLYYAADASNPNWIYINTLEPSAAGAQVLSTTYTLPFGATLQAVRARFRYQAAASSCGGPSSYEDHDDLIFGAWAESTVSGRITNGTGSGLSGKTVTLTGTPGTFSSAPSNANGDYIVTAPKGYSYTATANGSGESFTTYGTSTSSLTPLSGDVTNLNFAKSTPQYTASGTITINGGGGLTGVTVVPSASNHVAGGPGPCSGPDSQGHFDCFGLWQDTGYSIIPSKPNYVFTPASIDVSNNVFNLQFTGNPAATGNAVYDAVLKAPKCGSVGSVCDSGTLLNGRDNMSAGAEPNQPNTINNSCTDGTGGNYHADESIDAIKVSTLDASNFAAGQTVKIEVTVWAYSGFDQDHLDLYYAADASNPNWIYLKTLESSTVGAQVLSTTYPLTNGGSLQAVRARFRYQGAASSCAAGSSFDDYDDLIFAVQPTAVSSISGRVTNGNGVGLSGRTVSVTGTPGTFTSPPTNGNGDYVISGVPTGSNYTATANGPGENFQTYGQPSGSLTPLTGNVTNLNFAKNTPQYTASGNITINGGGDLTGLTVTPVAPNSPDASLSPSPCFGPDNQGHFDCFGLWQDTNYDIVPSKPNYVFTPTQINVTDNVFNLQFTGNPVPSVTVAVSPLSVTEDGAPNLVYTFTRTGVTTNSLTVNFSVGGTAALSTDYTQTGAATFGATSGTVTIGAGNSTATVTIDPSVDSTVETNETAILTVTSGTGYNVGSPSVATGTINNDDTDVTVAVSPLSVAEDGATNLVYTFTRNGVTTNSLTVNFSVGGTAAFSTDYTQTGAATFSASSGTVTIGAGNSAAAVTIDPSVDSTVETNETAILTVTSGTGYNVGSPSVATGTITNDDTDVTVAVSPLSVAEDGATNLVYTFTRNGVTTSSLTVNFSVGGTAALSTDYTQTGAATFGATSGTVTIGAGNSTATVTIDPSVDSTVETNETAILTVTSGTGYNVGSPSVATGTINNDDTDVTVAVSPLSVAEDGATNLVYTFTRNGVTTSSLTVNFSVGGTATFTTDYTQSGAATFAASSGTVTFGAGNSTATVTINPAVDSTVEPDETAILTVTSGTGYNVGSPSVATGTITNDDTDVTVAVSPLSVAEDGATNLVYTFTRNGVTTSSLTVNFSVGGTATFTTDYTQSGAATFAASSGTVTFGAGNSTATVTINPAVDSTVEPDETAILTVTSGTGYNVGSPGSAIGTITNDDGVGLRIDTVTPAAGRASGGQQTVLAGAFAGLSTVMMGGTSASWVYTNGAGDTSSITVTTPAHAVGAVQIDLTPASGSPYSKANAFAYLPTVFTDNTITAGQTTAKAQHILELRQAVDAMRAVAGLAPAPWTDATLSPGSRLIKAIHIQELRTYLDDAATRLLYSTSPYTDPSLTTGYLIKRIHIEELRQRIRNIAG